MSETENSLINRIESLCSEQGLRMTGQRRVIARVLATAKDHPDVEEVYRRANEIDERISLSTVYRTLKLFEEKGILERHDFGHGRGRYEEASSDHHDHLIDISTGRVIEFHSEAIEALQDGAQALSEAMQQQQQAGGGAAPTPGAQGRARARAHGPEAGPPQR